MFIEKIFIASDHAGYELKEVCKDYVRKFQTNVIDLGTFSRDISVDYPDFAFKLSKEVGLSLCYYGILICGTGIGISIAANRNHNIRCALCRDEFDARMAREHNNANVIAFGARTTKVNTVKSMCDIFFTTNFAGGRHQKRVDRLC